jgi:rare lipoprotein A
MTAAHPKLPLGTQVTVTNQDTGKAIKVEVNDRGPYVDGRNIDLPKGAAQKLGIVEQGVARGRDPTARAGPRLSSQDQRLASVGAPSIETRADISARCTTGYAYQHVLRSARARACPPGQ